jgi:catechol 2,3-dioxygenase-like lactoylglutathione lyase family enzyme
MKKICLLLSLACAASAAETPVITASGAFFALSVADMKASTQWYADKLGLKVVMQTPKQDKSAVTVLEGGGLIVELIQHDDAAPAAKDSLFVHGIFKAGVIVDDFDKTVAILKARQVEIAFGPFPKRANQRANVIVKDNAGNLIQFFGK